MAVFWKNVGKLIWPSEAFSKSPGRKRMVHLAERDHCGADHPYESLTLGDRIYIFHNFYNTPPLARFLKRASVSSMT